MFSPGGIRSGARGCRESRAGADQLSEILGIVKERKEMGNLDVKEEDGRLPSEACVDHL